MTLEKDKHTVHDLMYFSRKEADIFNITHRKPSALSKTDKQAMTSTTQQFSHSGCFVFYIIISRQQMLQSFPQRQGLFPTEQTGVFP